MNDDNMKTDKNRKQEASADHRLLVFLNYLNHIMFMHINIHIIGKRIVLVGMNRDIVAVGMMLLVCGDIGMDDF